MFGKSKHLLNNAAKKSEEVKRSAGKVVDPKRDTQQRAKHLRIFLVINSVTPYLFPHSRRLFFEKAINLQKNYRMWETNVLQCVFRAGQRRHR